MKNLSLLFVVLFMVSCTSNTIYKKPKDLIPKDTMVLLLTDLFIANTAYSYKNRGLRKKTNYMPLLYNKYKIDSVRFLESNLYYTSVIDEYDEVYKEVKSNLTALKLTLEKELKITDSLNLNGRPGKILKKNLNIKPVRKGGQ
ncbi:MAG: DUF4296 domain-containing protein [Flavobacteriaceae bacterium]|nr:DUF4296 domain-containing protein [Flavobacteriaceae bacterium]